MALDQGVLEKLDQLLTQLVEEPIRAYEIGDLRVERLRPQDIKQLRDMIRQELSETKGQLFVKLP